MRRGNSTHCRRGHNKEITGVFKNGACKACASQRTRKWRLKHPERHAARQRRWVRNKPKAAYLATRRVRLKQLYGITAEQYDRMFELQNGCCAICFRPPLKMKLAVDHCHESKRVRGLACYRCNKLRIGIAKDSEYEMYVRIAEYLASPFDGRTLV